MNEEQKAQALTIGKFSALAQAWLDGRHFCVWVQVGHELVLVPNLADETGAVEGVLHRVLERLVGALVEVLHNVGGSNGWSVWRVKGERIGAGSHPPTRLDAIVAALLALEVVPC